MQSTIDILEDQAGSAPFRFEGFASLIAPLGKDAFFARYWEKKPFLIKRNRPDHFGSLITLADLDGLIGKRLFRDNEIRIAKDGVMKPFAAFSLNGIVDRSAVLREYAQGATVVFEHLNRHHLALGKALARCEAELQIPFRANSYLTPSRSTGFARHYDTHDVMVLQVAGSKTWQIYSDPLPLPHEEQFFAPHWGDKATLIAELTLEPGDVLYLPRGYVHSASANEATSLHVTIGIRSMTLRDVTVSAMKKAALADPALRRVARFRDPRRAEALEHTRACLHALADRVDLRALFDDVLYSMIRKRVRPMDGRLLDRLAPPAIEHGTRLQLRPDCLMHLFERNGRLSLLADGKAIAFPNGVQQALGHVRQADSFTAAELSSLEHESRLILVRKLHAEGLLQAAPATMTEGAPA